MRTISRIRVLLRFITEVYTLIFGQVNWLYTLAIIVPWLCYGSFPPFLGSFFWFSLILNHTFIRLILSFLVIFVLMLRMVTIVLDEVFRSDNLLIIIYIVFTSSVLIEFACQILVLLIFATIRVVTIMIMTIAIIHIIIEVLICG